MSKFTNFLNLFKWNTVDDSEEEFDIDKALNDNWDKIDDKMEKHVNSTDLIHTNATQTKDGFMSKEDKTKIDNLEDKFKNLDKKAIPARRNNRASFSKKIRHRP